MEISSKHGVFLKKKRKKKTVNGSSMNNMTLYNDIHIYKLCANCDDKTKILCTQTKLGSMYIWVDYNGNGGVRYQVGKGQRLIVVHAGGVEG